MRILLVVVCCVCFVAIGCNAVNKSRESYEACKGDKACMAEMTAVKDKSYAVTKVAGDMALPSFSEALAIVVSSILAYGYGSSRGRKKEVL